tara:strand:+ start:236 stop:796 length:561 start_codon:yes stop_codon:yes gene_type:complete
MSKGMQLYQRDHFRDKLRRKLDPLIEQEELLLKSTISDMTESVEKTLAKKIGAERIIDSLQKAERDLEIARRKARSFFENTSKKNKTYRANKEWYGENDTDFSKISVTFCLNQIRKWAKALAEKKAEETNQGKKLGYLKNLKETCEDHVMEANVSEDLKKSLDDVLNNVGLTWNNKIKALPKTQQN